MPWSSNERLPNRVKNKTAPTANKQRAFRHAFESAREQGHDEGSQWAIATAAAQRAGRKGKKTSKSLRFRNYYHALLVEAGLLRE